MKTLVLTSIVISLSAATLFGQTQSDIEFLRARADAHERKISQLEKELSLLKAHLADKQAATTASNEPKAPKAIPVPESNQAGGTYVVQRGDILTRIAHREKTSVAAIMKANSLKNDHIYVGQKLRIPGAVAAAALPAPKKSGNVAGKEPKTTMAASSAPSSASKHIVKSGDTFYSVARDHKVSVARLMAANPRVEPGRMLVGQTLVIDGNANTAAASAAMGGASKSKSKEVARKAPAQSKSVPEPKIKTITLNDQMTYGQFATQYGASTTQLNELNGLNLSKNTMLAKGSELYVPKY